MLYFNIRRVLDLRGIDKPYAFLVKNGFVSQTATNIINNQIGRITPEQMEKLCLLLHCTPNDLFDWRASADSVVPENHPLRTLVKEKNAPSLSQMIKDLPVAKLGQLEAIIKDLKSAE